MGMPNAIKCNLCSDKAFFEIKECNNHIKNYHRSTNFVGNAFKCESCDAFFDTCNELTDHIAAAH